MRLSALLGRQVRRPSGPLGRLLGHSMARGHRALTEWAISLMNIQPPSCVLDVGCGSGMAIRLMRSAAVAGFVAGVDYSPVMVRQARRRNAADVRSGRVAVLHGDVSALPFPDGSFDRLSAIETFYFWPQPLARLAEVRRVLRPGGLAAITMEMSKEENPATHNAADAALAYGFTIYSAAEMEQMLRQAGFAQVRCVCRPRVGDGWLCALGVAA
jgi:ubiquinone/menaquinone biosynthesis C-methylase UbiE